MTAKPSPYVHIYDIETSQTDDYQTKIMPLTMSPTQLTRAWYGLSCDNALTSTPPSFTNCTACCRNLFWNSTCDLCMHGVHSIEGKDPGHDTSELAIKLFKLYQIHFKKLESYVSVSMSRVILARQSITVDLPRWRCRGWAEAWAQVRCKGGPTARDRTTLGWNLCSMRAQEVIRDKKCLHG